MPLTELARAFEQIPIREAVRPRHGAILETIYRGERECKTPSVETQVTVSQRTFPTKFIAMKRILSGVISQAGARHAVIGKRLTADAAVPSAFLLSVPDWRV